MMPETLLAVLGSGELQAASEAMKASGHMGYEEPCKQFPRTLLDGNAPAGTGDELQQPAPFGNG